MISTNGGMAAGNDGSIANMPSPLQTGPEEGAPPEEGVAAPAEGVPGAQPPVGEAPTATEEIQAAAAVRSWLSRPLHTRLGPQAPDLVLSTFRGSQIPCREWVSTLEKWNNFGTRPMTYEELETFCATVSEVGMAHTGDLASHGMASLPAAVGGGPVPLPGARADGAVEMWLDKKSPSVMKGWQRRWFVFHPSGDTFYFTDPSKESKAASGKKAKGGEMKQMFKMKDCIRISSQSKARGQFELHFQGGKVHMLRAESSASKTIEQGLGAVEEVVKAMKANGALNDSVDGSIREAFADPILAAHAAGVAAAVAPAATTAPAATSAAPAAALETVPAGLPRVGASDRFDGVRMGKALYPWNVELGASPGDLTFNPDDVIELVSDEPGQGWRTGVLGGRQGIFPANYVEEISQTPAPPQQLQAIPAAGLQVAMLQPAGGSVGGSELSAFSQPVEPVDDPQRVDSAALAAQWQQANAEDDHDV